MNGSLARLAEAVLTLLIPRTPPATVSPSDESTLWRPVKPSETLVFLDFDGVIHRAENGSFERTPHLCRLLSALPEVAIVLSTNWRLGSTPEWLVENFPLNIRHRFVGVTPSFPLLNREAECLAVVRQTGCRRYVAIDDDSSLFSSGCAFLHLTDRYEGLNDKAVDELIDRLRTLS